MRLSLYLERVLLLYLILLIVLFNVDFDSSFSFCMPPKKAEQISKATLTIGMSACEDSSGNPLPADVSSFTERLPNGGSRTVTRQGQVTSQLLGAAAVETLGLSPESLTGRTVAAITEASANSSVSVKAANTKADCALIKVSFIQTAEADLKEQAGKK